MSRAARSRCPSTTSPRMKVCYIPEPSALRRKRAAPQTCMVFLTFLFSGEKARITAAGGFVDFGRVNGNLALSRAIGDFEFKKSAELAPEQQIVTAYPDVVVHDLSDDDEFLVIACDGSFGPSVPYMAHRRHAC